MQVRRTMEWGPILISFLFILVALPVRGNTKEDSRAIRFELVHRHDHRLLGDERLGITRLNLIKDIARRDILRHQQRRDSRRGTLETYQTPMHGGIDYQSAEYFVQLRIGTPPQKFWVIADTGSELTWFRCRNTTIKPRKERSRVSTVKPFLAHRSRTFQMVECGSTMCKDELANSYFSIQICPKPSDPCLYDSRYDDGSIVEGYFGTDIMTLDLTNGKKKKVPDLVIGCSRNIVNKGTLHEKVAGLMGLSHGKNSFLAKAATLYGGKFSYCLVDHLSPKNVSNFLTLGSYGSNKTKLLGEMRKTLVYLDGVGYGVQVEGISIGGQMLKIPAEVWDFRGKGGTSLDSGTSLTMLAKPAYDAVVDVYLKFLSKYKRAVLDETTVLEHCFEIPELDESEVPRLVIHFAWGARFEPAVKSYITKDEGSVRCLGFVEGPWPGPNTIGNILQQNHLWEFELYKQILWFAPSTCT